MALLLLPIDASLADGLRVVGGEPALPAEHPAVVAVVYPNGVLCTGTLFRRDAVITAAHCLTPSRHGDAVPGVSTAHDVRSGVDIAIVAGRSKHVPETYDPRVDPPDSPDRYDDIGVLVLETAIDVEPVPLLSPAEAAIYLEEGVEVELVGYGIFTLDPVEGGIKHKAVATVVEVGDFEFRISDSGEPQNCGGDSGGPALLNADGEIRVAGVVSRSAERTSECAAGGIDTRIDVHARWAEDIAAEFSSLSGGCTVAPRGASLGLVALALAWTTVGWRRRRRSRASSPLDTGRVS